MKILEKFEKYIIFTSLFLLPLFFMPSFESLFDTPKLMILFIGVFIVLLIKLAKSIMRKGFEFNSSKFDLPVAFFMLAYLISGIFSSTNRVDSFFLPGSASFAILAGIYYYLVNQLSKEDKGELVNLILTSGFIMATMQIGSFLGITKLIPQLPEVTKVNYFSPFGNILSSIVFLIALIPLLISKIMSKTDLPEKILSVIVGLVLFISISTSIYLVLPGKASTPMILDLNSSWSIAIDSLKANPFLGVGPSNYVQAFTQFKPVVFNSQANWNVKYLQGSSTLLTIFTEIGIIGLLSALLIFYMVLRKIDYKNYLYTSLVILTLGLIFLPISQAFLTIVFLMLALNSESKDDKIAFFVKRYALIFLLLPVLLIILAIGYFFGRAFYAETIFANAIKQVNAGEGVKAYELANKAIKINYYSDRYHLLSSGINLAFAENIAKKEKLEYYMAFNEFNNSNKIKPMISLLTKGLMESLHKRIAYLKGLRVIRLSEFVNLRKLSGSSIFNSAKRQSIPAFRERGVWKIGVK